MLPARSSPPPLPVSLSLQKIKEAKIATMNAIASGTNSRPAIPPRANSGRKTRTIARVAKMIGVRTSTEASRMTCKRASGAGAF